MSGIDFRVLAEAMHVVRNHHFDHSGAMHPNDHPLANDLVNEASAIKKEYDRLVLLTPIPEDEHDAYERRLAEAESPLGHGTPVPEEATLPSGDERVSG